MSKASSVIVKLRADMDNDKDDSASTGYARLREETIRPASKPSQYSLKYHVLVGISLLVLFILSGLLGGIIALRIHLKDTSNDLMQTGEVLAYQNVISNLTTILSNTNRKGKTQDDVVGSTAAPSVVNSQSTVYIRWGASVCPNSAKLIYEGVTASGGSQIAGGGSNHMCMTSNPDFLAPMSGRQGGRSHIFGSEYRNGANYEPLNNIHGHDAPCVACLAPRNNLLMIPGATTCPSGGNWTREYYGYLMAARNDLKRNEYICVDANAETVPGSVSAYNDADILFPVEAYCNENVGGGLPCSPYVDGYEVTCAVCTL